MYPHYFDYNLTVMKCDKSCYLPVRVVRWHTKDWETTAKKWRTAEHSSNFPNHYFDKMLPPTVYSSSQLATPMFAKASV